TKYQDKVTVSEYEIYYNQENAQIFSDLVKELNIEVAGVPLLIINEDYVLGYGSEETTGIIIEEKIKKILGNEKTNENSSAPVYLNIFSKKIDLKSLSLPIATILIAFVDGFNPCAMWILIFLITMLINMKDKKKLYLLGTTFILVSGLMYLLFLSAWFNFFKYIGYVYWVKIIIGIVAIICGILHIKNGLFSKGECKVTNQTQRQKIIQKIKDILTQKKLFFSLIGITTLAVSVNLIEIVCSAGLPAVYTNLLSTIKLSTFEYYFYLFLYVLIFMLDDLIIFFLAIKTFEVSGISKKYTKLSGIVGGIIILIIGIILIIKPELLMFG
ncbi:MAG: hypothetical protein PHH12_01915, partial [Candidatus Shapirobacteria bacterium]|nr:hypothetical protein [Candidatus Shapirobacteria bacterium]